jgi:hypothetical protein
LSISLLERRLRMARLRGRVASHDVTAWATTFLRRLEESHSHVFGGPVAERAPLAAAFTEERGVGPCMCFWTMTGPWCHSHGFQNWPDRIRIC